MVTSDLGRVTTTFRPWCQPDGKIVVTSDLGRVTTAQKKAMQQQALIVVTSDLGRVTTLTFSFFAYYINCGDVRSRTSYN